MPTITILLSYLLAFVIGWIVIQGVLKIYRAVASNYFLRKPVSILISVLLILSAVFILMDDRIPKSATSPSGLVTAPMNSLLEKNPSSYCISHHNDRLEVIVQ